MEWSNYSQKKHTFTNSGNAGLSQDEISSMKADALRRVQRMQEQARNSLSYINYSEARPFKRPDNPSPAPAAASEPKEANPPAAAVGGSAGEGGFSLIFALMALILSESGNVPLAAALLYLLS
ncbi:MAG: hypothetical protein LBC56_08795 [Oscillospiraceae bacterium]|nr:hypothetical protein [Oscillospiraceae bacterium]